MNIKKIIKYFSFAFILLYGLLGITKVSAQAYGGQIKGGAYVGGPYYIMHKKGASSMWLQGEFIVRTSDGHFVYCVQPMTKINSNSTYDVSTDGIAAVLNISQDTWNQISRIAYYGYGYKDANYDHTDDRYYLATQMLIWRLADSSVDSYFTDTLKGNRNDNILASQMNEVQTLANQHRVVPNLSNFPSSMVVGQTITINDNNNVINSYSINDIQNGTISKNGNSLTITATAVGDLSFSLDKSGNRYGNPVELYYAIDSQNVIRRGDIDPIKINKKITIYGGDVEINKTDAETLQAKAQGEATLKGAVYGIYKEDGTKVATITTGENGIVKSDYLPSLGRFYVLEEKASTGYELDKNRYYFDVTIDNLHPQIQVFEKVIKRDVEITKVYADSKTGIMTPEVGVKFGIYNSKNELVVEKITDSQGNIKMSLPYGIYKIKQLTTTSGYEKVKDFNVEISTSGEAIKKVIANAEITARLKVIKIDKDTGEVIKRSGIKFRIINSKTGEVVKQKVTYPTIKILDTFETDETGILITPYPLNSGSYYLEEVDQKLDGYLWNKESVEFTIDENSMFLKEDTAGIIFEVKFNNKEVKGQISIHKIGEKAELTDKGYIYTKVNLSGVKIGLYASEDIYSANGVIKYLKDQLIDSYITDENGNIKVENLYLGSYYLLEIETDKDHVLDNNKYQFDLKYKDQYTDMINYNIELDNHLKKGNLEFTKTDLTTGKVIQNTMIEIYNEKDELVSKNITDELGKVKIENLLLGKYYIIETEASTGYKISDEKVYFEITKDGEIIKANMTNEKITSTITIHKIDDEGNPLEGVLIGVYDLENNLIYQALTNIEGNIEYKLEYGKYYFQEIKGLDGYQINEEKVYFEITKDGEYIQKTLINATQKVEVPNTSKNELPILPICIISSLLGLGLIIYGKKKK